MTLSVVASRYANALADVLTARDSALPPQDAVAQLRAFQDVVHNSPDLHNALITPAVPGSRKKAVVGRLADRLGLHRIARNFLFVLIDHRRIDLLSQIIVDLDAVVDERLGFARAEVTAAKDLSEPQRASLGSSLERLTGKKIRMHITVDPSLIGGVVARVGSTIYDGSLRGQLASLEHRLTAQV